MGQLIRFGRRVPLPSTVQIVHDLLVAQREENAKRLDAAKANGAQDGAAKAKPDAASEVVTLPVPPHGS